MVRKRNPGGQVDQSEYADLYDRAIESLLTIPVRDEWIDTRAGRTHVLTAGEQTSEPVLVFQGGNVTTPVTLAWIQELAEDFYLVAPDTPGEPGKSSPQQSPGYGPWVTDLLDGLGREQVPMVGASHGAGVVLEAAAYAPDRVPAAGLLVPAGFGTPLSVNLARVVLPALAYRVVPRRWLLTRALTPMFTQPVSAIEGIVIETISTALRTSDLGAEFPGPDSPEELGGFRAPTLVITADSDPFFPGARTCERAADYLPSLVDCIRLPDERHFLSPPAQREATARIRSFMSDHYGLD